ncbi:probable tRNA (uracil-O(2)-)-methyltransferase [Protopterus annectens]|uniref:probable tRNA (uracil-O(2)-)-methyltransferase n=1 Tax=Protopterus annectens TaxID=7888 RepID=UPI001CFBF0AA|nr:probable tRNA (uracil-O(2)-)-methyltransferase [Protopterus annectens]
MLKSVTNMTVIREITLEDPTGALPERFWSAVDVWIEKPHVVNRRLCGMKLCDEREVHEKENLLQVLQDLSKIDVTILSELVATIHCCSQDVHSNLWARNSEGYKILLRSVIPKSSPRYKTSAGKEMIIKDFCNKRATFIPLVEENSEGMLRLKQTNIYQVQLAENASHQWLISVSALCLEDWEADGVIYPKVSWLGAELLSKLAKWSTENKISEFKSTLSLISVEKYNSTYHRLKEQYKEMVKVWPEVTDPEKFVFEDVAIATYLLVLWEEEQIKKSLPEKQSFVDLGCGNGLLVHILTNEGHRGKGIDVRRRKIWDMYGPQTLLEECAIIPGDSFLFPGIDWLIGNHSDELTPWLPVIAARSSYFCRYFVLPCCFFDLYGKYCRKQSRNTQYREYLDFVIEVGSICGFQVEEDTLRIPSTKRVCLIGKERSYSYCDEIHIDEQRKDYINSRQQCSLNVASGTSCFTERNCETSNSTDNINNESSKSCSDERTQVSHDKCNLNTSSSGSWITNFQPREKTEQVRNCASLPRDFINSVVLQVASALLEAGKSQNQSAYKQERAWNKGGTLTLREVAELLSKDTLQKLKNECGGLQTLLKNSHQVFEVAVMFVFSHKLCLVKQERLNEL